MTKSIYYKEILIITAFNLAFNEIIRKSKKTLFFKGLKNSFLKKNTKKYFIFFLKRLANTKSKRIFAPAITKIAA